MKGKQLMDKARTQAARGSGIQTGFDKGKRVIVLQCYSGDKEIVLAMDKEAAGHLATDIISGIKMIEEAEAGNS